MMLIQFPFLPTKNDGIQFTRDMARYFVRTTIATIVDIASVVLTAKALDKVVGAEHVSPILFRAV